MFENGYICIGKIRQKKDRVFFTLSYYFCLIWFIRVWNKRHNRKDSHPYIHPRIS